MVYNLLFLLYETAPLFEFTWVEYLADVSRYRYAFKSLPNFSLALMAYLG